MPTKICAACGADFNVYQCEIERRRYCSRECSRSTQLGRFINDTATFWARVDRSDLDGCWPWLGTRKKRTNYGVMSWGAEPEYAHRLAWILTNGQIDDGLHVLHRCDNPPCCRPDHLFLGTQAENMADMYRKGRHGNTRLSADAVAEIAALTAAGFLQADLAARFGVAQTTISYALRCRAQ